MLRAFGGAHRALTLHPADALDLNARRVDRAAGAGSPSPPAHNLLVSVSLHHNAVAVGLLDRLGGVVGNEHPAPRRARLAAVLDDRHPQGLGNLLLLDSPPGHITRAC